METNYRIVNEGDNSKNPYPFFFIILKSYESEIDEYRTTYPPY